MASTHDYVEYVADMLAIGNVRYKKMFGEYMVYVNDKPLVLVCDNTAFVKILPCLDSLMAKAERGSPYDGAKEHYILDVEDRELAERVIEELAKVIDVPKTKNKKSVHPKVLYHFTSLYHLNKILLEK
jgi:TfoX/Sxy family transcriptional regulator of competence genes